METTSTFKNRMPESDSLKLPTSMKPPQRIIRQQTPHHQQFSFILFLSWACLVSHDINSVWPFVCQDPGLGQWMLSPRHHEGPPLSSVPRLWRHHGRCYARSGCRRRRRGPFAVTRLAGRLSWAPRSDRHRELSSKSAQKCGVHHKSRKTTTKAKEETYSRKKM